MKMEMGVLKFLSRTKETVKISFLIYGKACLNNDTITLVRVEHNCSGEQSGS